jgi:hypothetical protein
MSDTLVKLGKICLEIGGFGRPIRNPVQPRPSAKFRLV